MAQCNGSSRPSFDGRSPAAPKVTQKWAVMCSGSDDNDSDAQSGSSSSGCGKEVLHNSNTCEVCVCVADGSGGAVWQRWWNGVLLWSAARGRARARLSRLWTQPSAPGTAKQSKPGQPASSSSRRCRRHYSQPPAQQSRPGQPASRNSRCPLSCRCAEKPSGLGMCRSSASGFGCSPPWARWIHLP